MIDKEKKVLKNRAYLIFFGFVAVMITIIYTVISIQFTELEPGLMPGDRKIPERIVLDKPTPGDVLDKDLNPLVTTVSYYDVYMDPVVVSEALFESKIDSLAVGISDLFHHKSAAEISAELKHARKNGKRYVLIQKQVTNEQRKSLRALPIFKEGTFKGGIIDGKETSVRKNPKGQLAKRTLGYYRKDGEKVVAVGIEGAYQNYLAGVSGQQIQQKLANGWRNTGVIVQESVAGSDIVTTIDSDIQEVAHSELEKQLITMDAPEGCVIVMEVATGYIRAISNLRRNSDSSYSESFNYAIGRNSPPGSTFKLAALMAALEDGKLTLDTEVNAAGEYRFKGSKKSLFDSNNGNGYGKISLKRAFELSSNVIAPTIHEVYKSDPDQFIAKLEKFGLTKPLGISLPGEPSPKVSRPGSKIWSGISIPYMSIGYELEQTPLQTLNLYNSVANNGRMMRPQFVKEVRSSGNIIRSFDPIVLDEKICSMQTIKKVKSCLIGVMEDGTGKDLKSVEFKIAGKTGTVKLLSKSREFLGRSESEYQASFCGFFPADKPLYSCIVVIYKPKKYIYGAKVSGTVFAAVANKVFASNLKYHEAVNEAAVKSNSLPRIKAGNKADASNVLANLGYEHNVEGGGEWIGAVRPLKEINLIPREIKENRVPSVSGMTAKDAIYLLEKMGLIVEIKGFGKVIYQSIPEGTDLENGRLIKLTLKNI
jgi:cell division protein FtsI (penicillin-binding protein 3)